MQFSQKVAPALKGCPQFWQYGISMILFYVSIYIARLNVNITSLNWLVYDSFRMDLFSIKLFRSPHDSFTLAKNFGGESNTCKALGLSKADWSKLGQIANDEPLNQGRHRGVHAGILRAATNTELQDARSISQGFILAYLNYLDKVSI